MSKTKGGQVTRFKKKQHLFKKMFADLCGWESHGMTDGKEEHLHTHDLRTWFAATTATTRP
jgi:hypothetical protein